MYKIGIDVGGTNTDAVILDHQIKLDSFSESSNNR